LEGEIFFRRKEIVSVVEINVVCRRKTKDFLRSEQRDSEVERRVCTTEGTEFFSQKEGVSTVKKKERVSTAGRKEFQQPEKRSFCS
jgi:hypothetical protein